MRRLFFAEASKLFKSRFCLISVCVLLCANFFLLWFSTQNQQNTIPSSAYKLLTQDIENKSAKEIQTFLKESSQQAQGLANIEYVMWQEALEGGKNDAIMRKTYANDFKSYYDLYLSGNYLRYTSSLDTECYFLNLIFSEFEKTHNYEGFLDGIEKKAQTLSSISIFAKNQNSFEIKNLQKTARDFEDMRGTEITFYPQKGITTALSSYFTDIVLIFAMLSIATVLVRTEREKGLLSFLRTMPSGRAKIAIAKFFVLASSLAIMVFLLYGMNLLYCNAVYGIGPQGRTIQSIADLMSSTWALTLTQYLGVYAFAKWIAAVVCGMWVVFAMLVVMRTISGVVLSISFFVVSWLVRIIIPAISHWNIFKYGNLVSILRTNEVLGSYQNLYWFGCPVSILWIELAAVFLFGICFFFLFSIQFQKNSFSKITKKDFGRLLPKNTCKYTTPFRQEWRKLLLTQGALILLLCFAALQAFTALSTKHRMTAEEVYYRHYMVNIEGKYTKDKHEWLMAQKKEFNPILKAQADFHNKKISLKQYELIMSSYNSLMLKYNVYTQVVATVNSVNQVEGMQVVYERGWYEAFDLNDKYDLISSLVVGFFCSICFSGFFAMEKQTGMIKIIAHTPKGRRHTAWCKLRVCAITAGVVAVLSIAPQFFVAIKNFGLGAWAAPIYSLPEYSSLFGAPIFMVVYAMLLARYISILGMSVVILAFSEKIGNAIGTIFVSLSIFVFPVLLSIIGLTDVKWLSIYLPFHMCGWPRKLSALLGSMICILLLLIILITSNYLLDAFGASKRKK